MTQEAFNKEIDTIYKEYLQTDIFCLVDALHIIEKYGIYSDVNKKKVLKEYNPHICPAFITFFCDKYGFIQQYDSIKIDYETQINKLNQIIESHLIKEKEYINRIIDLDLAKSNKQKEFIEKPRAIKSTFFDSQYSSPVKNPSYYPYWYCNSQYSSSVKNPSYYPDWYWNSQYSSPVKKPTRHPECANQNSREKELTDKINYYEKREKELLEKINILENKIKNVVSVCDNIIE